MEHKDLSRILETAVVAARLAGQRAMEEINFIKASIKSDASMVTETDCRCQKIIIDKIKEDFSDYGIIAEEGADGTPFKQSPRGDDDIWWVIDPIDGTNNFAHQILNFTVSIALMHNGRPVAGVIFEPATESMFTAVQDGPAQCNGRRILASENDFSKFECLGIESMFEGELPGWVSKLMSKMRCRAIGTTAMELAYVAKGAFIATISQKPKIWDIAAGAFMAETAGAVVTDWQDKKIWPVNLQNYNKEPFNIIAANKKTHGKLLKIIAENG